MFVTKSTTIQSVLLPPNTRPTNKNSANCVITLDLVGHQKPLDRSRRQVTRVNQTRALYKHIVILQIRERALAPIINHNPLPSASIRDGTHPLHFLRTSVVVIFWHKRNRWRWHFEWGEQRRNEKKFCFLWLFVLLHADNCRQ